MPVLLPPDADAPAPPSADGLRSRAESALRLLVGSESATLHPDQWTAIEALVQGRRRVLVVQRTGWGKSAVYFVSTALLRAAGAGPTVIVSPLLALMRNQIAAAERAGIRAVTVNSANAEQWQQVYEQVRAGDVDVLLVSPERLVNPGFRDEVLPQLSATAGLVVIDEAHCVSDWGHDFRPDYRRIRTLLQDLPSGIPVLATTATANARVTADVAEQLRAPARPGAGDGAPDRDPAEPDDVVVLRGTLDRESLRLAVVDLPDQASRLAWLVEQLPVLDGSGIVYCLTVAAVEQVADHLRRAGPKVAAYTGQTDPTERLHIEEDLLANRVKAVVATSALGMGFDKPDLGFVVHLGAPPSPIAYYQQIGRAGRGVARATVVLLPAREDQDIWRYFGSLAFPAEQHARAALAVLSRATKPLSVASLETSVDLRRSRLEMMLKVLDVDGAVRRVGGGWVTTGEPWSYDGDRYARVAAAREAEQQAMLDYEATEGCRLRFLREQLDDADARDCGRCDNCGGVELPTAVSADTVAAARNRLQVPGLTVAPRAQWPSAMTALGVDLSGRIAAGERAEPGRAVGRLDGLGWGSALRSLFRTAVPGPDRDPDVDPDVGRGAASPVPDDGPTPVPLRQAAVDVLLAWPEVRPPGGGTAVDVVVGTPSVRRPQLVHHLASGLARYLEVPFLDVLELAERGAPPSGVNSAQRLRAVVHRFRVTDPSAVAGRRVLLVDDRTDTGWTLTVAARELRRAGAEAVYPFVLGVG
ncbi:RecQ family ATP-dependent DNA helicase [Nakamurella endophytica]|uniref:DNA 3'-5' helicase n=1 Tax=Nakamurella endophytica TaxID=1748367 RepID=A0A917WCI0_9ACTN|nr:RecQ family ATP-dependent DNA helicase [Nakamurella endophytica]GGL89791.1 ATP-dependent DNA helicase RecQ [Nakamurella endophytica]